jgi:hypothetical protein
LQVRRSLEGSKASFSHKASQPGLLPKKSLLRPPRQALARLVVPSRRNGGFPASPSNAAGGGAERFARELQPAQEVPAAIAPRRSGVQCLLGNRWQNATRLPPGARRVAGGFTPRHPPHANRGCRPLVIFEGGTSRPALISSWRMERDATLDWPFMVASRTVTG